MRIEYLRLRAWAYNYSEGHAGIRHNLRNADVPGVMAPACHVVNDSYSNKQAQLKLVA